MRSDDGYYKCPDLPFPLHALEPHISRETLAYHHGKHHRGYVDRLNQLIAGTPLAGEPLARVVVAAEGALFNQAAQAFNHNFYWHSLSPERGLAPRGMLAAAIDLQFGSLDACLTTLHATALGTFGSGWTWLVRRANGTLAVESTKDADTPLRRGDTPLLVCDVWEHAYYLDYKNDRKRYLDAFLGFINWDTAVSLYDSAVESARLPPVGPFAHGGASPAGEGSAAK